jgi:AraC-like DNA-binding protein
LIEFDTSVTQDVRAMAERVNLSLSRFYDLFRRETGSGPTQYIRAIRFKKAENLLLTSHLSVKEIANAVGVHDVSHFVRDFEKHFGMSPRRFRRAHDGTYRAGQIANKSQ